jgi:hypothetical protein
MESEEVSRFDIDRKWTTAIAQGDYFEDAIHSTRKPHIADHLLLLESTNRTRVPSVVVGQYQRNEKTCLTRYPSLSRLLYRWLSVQYQPRKADDPFKERHLQRCKPENHHTNIGNRVLTLI